MLDRTLFCCQSTRKSPLAEPESNRRARRLRKPKLNVFDRKPRVALQKKL
jgi:hypothetical protein